MIKRISKENIGGLTMKKEYIVFNQRLAGYLMQQGFVLKRMEKSNQENSNRNVFVFNNTDDLIKKVKEYKVI